MSPTKYARLFLASLLILGVAFIARSLVMGGVTTVVKLQPGTPMGGAISQTLASPDGKLPVLNKDYSIQNIVSFDDGDWAVVTIKQVVSGQSNSALIVLKHEDGLYKTVLGPGTAFPDTYLQTLPANVGGYLYNQGAIYGTTN